MEKATPPHQDKPPRWDLRDLFPSQDSAGLAAAFHDIETESAGFARQFTGRVSKLSGAALGQAISQYEKISESIARIEAYIDLTRAADIEQSAWAQDAADRLRKSSEALLFFPLEINKIRETDLLQKIAAPGLAAYAPWIGKVRAGREHQLSDAAEKFQHKMQPVTEDAWRRLYDQLMLDLRVSIRGKEMTEGETVSLIDTSPDAKLRRDAYAAFGKTLDDNKKGFSLITNTLADLKSVDDRWRNFERAEDARHLDNQIERETVETLVKTVREQYPKNAHRYYAWKAKKSGVARLHPADRNAPLPGEGGRKYTWDEAKEIVLAGFAKISPEMEKTGREFFDKNWIDAEPRADKDSGGFSHPTVPSAHPYILMNFYGTAADVMVLAHELGHGIHQVMAAKQGFLRSDTPLTLAETASVFGEMIVFRELLSREDDLVARRNMVAQKVEDMLNTVNRQTAFFVFEQRLHAERRDKGELSPERIGELWLDTQKESLGPSVNLDVPGAQHFWMDVPHFIHTPFYTYAYAFGDCLVNALYDEYSKAVDKPAFVAKYEDLLKAGGTKTHEAALAEFGFDPSDAGFWKKGLSVIERYIDEVEQLDKRIDAIHKMHQDFKNAVGEVSDLKRAVNDDKPHAVDPPHARHSRKGPKMGGA
ncbi:MAG TPA: M3 family oligoendopeptidase [Patescibacteria group bacterium]|nr:M3 family oligoendopeptidase [Patescibacteria group bacterium]